MKDRIIAVLLKASEIMSFIKFEFDDIPGFGDEIETELKEITDILNEIKHDYMIVNKRKIN